MTRRILVLLSAVALLAGMLPAAAQTIGADSDRFRPVPGQGANVPLDGLDRDPDQLVNVFIQFTTPSVARFTADRIEATGHEPSQGQKQAQADAVAAQHEVMRTVLSSLIAREQSAQKYAINGLTVWVRAGDIPAISRIPGVMSVMNIKQHYPDHVLSVPTIGVPTVWNDFQYTGDGMLIAIIDSGVDYHHATFGGSGDPADYAADDGLTLNEFFPNDKIIGGHDFVGDAYNAQATETATPMPDPNPLDCDTGNAGGHGTHVAGTAGGYGVLANGNTFTGPYDSDTFNDNEFLVGPGVAPDVRLIALRVFGCSGSSAVVHEAIDWVVAWNVVYPLNRIHVINMSLGSSFGETSDPSALAAENAAGTGIVVTASTGNAGNIPYITGSPAVSPSLISVAGSIAGGTLDVLALLVTAPEEMAGDMYPMTEAAFGTPLAESGPVTGELIAGLSSTGVDVEGCGPLENAEEVAGNIVLLRRGTCAFVIKYENAIAAGATALVVYNNTSGPPIAMGGDAEGDIPAVMISDVAGAELLAGMAEATVEVELSADNTMPLDITPDEPYASSSRGPGREGSTFKPEVTAPAVNVESADVGTGTGGVRFSGTSMAAPHVAGVAALLLQAHPTADPTVIKSLMMNSGRPLVPNNLPITRQAAGVVQADVAVNLSAYTSPGGVAFGRLNPINPEVTTESVQVNNMSGAEVTFDIDVTRYDTVSGVTVSAPASVTVPANGSASFDLTIALNPAAMPDDDAFQSQREAYGALTLTSAGDTLRVAFNAVVDGASNTVALDGAAGYGLTNDSDQYSLAHAFTAIGGGGGFDALGAYRASPAVGVLGIALDEPWTPFAPLVMDVWLDVNQDGDYDYLVRGVDFGVIQGLPYNGQYVSVFYNFGAGTATPQFFAEVDFNDRVMGLIFNHGGLVSGEVDYLAEFWNLRSGETMAMTDGSFDMDTAHGAVYVDVEAGDTLSNADLGPLAAPGILWLFPNNQVEAQAHVTVGAEPTVGAFDPQTGLWHLRNSAGDVTSFYYGNPNDMPIVGDWNGDGIDTVGLYRQSNGFVYLRNSNTQGNADITFFAGNPGDIAIAGDFNGNGFDTVSLYRPSTGQVFIFNSLGADGGGLGAADITYYFGNPDDKPFTGDFNGNGVDTVGLHRESTGLLYFRNSHTQGNADFEFYFGNPDDRLFAGDWTLDGIDTPGVFRPSNTTWYFRHTNTQGNADSQFVWGEAQFLPVAGNFGLD